MLQQKEWITIKQTKPLWTVANCKQEYELTSLGWVREATSGGRCLELQSQDHVWGKQLWVPINLATGIWSVLLLRKNPQILIWYVKAMFLFISQIPTGIWVWAPLWYLMHVPGHCCWFGRWTVIQVPVLLWTSAYFQQELSVSIHYLSTWVFQSP